MGGGAESSGEQGGGNEGEGVTAAALMVFGLILQQVQAGVLQAVCGLVC